MTKRPRAERAPDVDIGVALWTLQSTVASPTGHGELHARFVDEARQVEALGFHSLWVAEHRFWYDGWSPSPLTLLAAAAAATSSLRLGTGMALLPQHDPTRFTRNAITVDAIADGRLEVGVGLGHRDAEYDGLGIERRHRGLRMDAALDELVATWGPRRGTDSLWIGGMAPAAIARGSRLGTSFLLPQTLSHRQLDRIVGAIGDGAAEAGRPRGRIGALRDVWLTDGAAEAARVRDLLAGHYREEIGSWWIVGDAGHGFRDPAALQAQIDRAVDAAVIGTPAEVRDRLLHFGELGVDLLALRFRFDVTRDAAPPVLERFSETVLPALRSEEGP